jgi:hypothetical protein
LQHAPALTRFPCTDYWQSSFMNVGSWHPLFKYFLIAADCLPKVQTFNYEIISLSVRLIWWQDHTDMSCLDLFPESAPHIAHQPCNVSFV